MNSPPVCRHGMRRKQRARWLVHERHEFVGKARHGAANANPADIRAAADSSHPTTLSDVALHYRSPAAQFHDALNRAIFLGKLRLLVVTAPVTSFMYGLTEQP